VHDIRGQGEWFAPGARKTLTTKQKHGGNVKTRRMYNSTTRIPSSQSDHDLDILAHHESPCHDVSWSAIECLCANFWRGQRCDFEKRNAIMN